MITELQKRALGLSGGHLVAYQQGERRFLVEKNTLQAFLLLQQEAKKAGFDLAMVSSYRDFSRQALIWNGKAKGLRDLLDASGRPLLHSQLNPQQLLEAILLWSAVPGLSRHHWGSDIDIFDASAMALNEVQLTPAEVEAGGLCAELHRWLDDSIVNNQSFGFFRPYSNQACKVAEEKWHLSYWPVAKQMEQALSAEFALKSWQQYQLCLLEQLEQQVDSIFNDYACLDKQKLPSWVK